MFFVVFFPMQVNVVSFGALCDREVVLSALDKSLHHGHWLVFSNCHLLDHWDGGVLARLDHLTSLLKGDFSVCWH